MPKDLLEPAKSLTQLPPTPNNIQQQAHEAVQQYKDPEIFGIPFSMIKDGLLIGSLAFTGVVGAKVFIIDPYINMLQRQQQQQIFLEREKSFAVQQKQKQQQKQVRVQDNTTGTQQAQNRPIGFGGNSNFLDNTDSAKATIVSNDVMSNSGNGNVAPLGINYKVIDNSDISNPYESTYSNALVEAREQSKQETKAPQNTQHTQKTVQPTQSLRDPRSTAETWPSTQSWPSRANTQAKAQEVKQAISTSDINSGTPGDTNHVTTEDPSILEQQLANDEEGYY